METGSSHFLAYKQKISEALLEAVSADGGAGLGQTKAPVFRDGLCNFRHRVGGPVAQD